MLTKLPLHFSIISSSPVHRTIAWQVLTEQIPEKISITGFNIYFSETAQGVKIKLNKELITRPEFRHNVANYSHYPRAEYRIEAVLAGGQRVMSQAFDVYSNDSEDRHTEALRLHTMYGYMQGSVKIPAFCYPRPVAGIPCDCALPNQGGSAYNCERCQGTSITGGYHDPVLIFIKFSVPDSKNRSVSKQGVEERNLQVIETSCEFLMIQPYDVIREYYSPHTLYLVQSLPEVDKYTMRPTRQVMQVKQADSSHPLYKKDLPVIEYLPEFIHYKKYDYDEGRYLDCREIYAKILNSVKARPAGN